MKKLLTSIAAIMLIAPIFANAQTAPQQSKEQIRAELIVLIQQVIQLENQLLAMQQTTTTAEATQAPVAQVAAPVQQPPVVIPPANPEATVGQAPIVAGDPAPQPSGYSIQIIAWPGPVNQVNRTFIANPSLNKPSDDPTDNSHVNLGAILMNPSGQAVNDAIMTVITPDNTQNTQIDGTGNIYGAPAVAYYPFSYAFKTVGAHTITFTAMGATNSITLQAD